MNKNIRTLLVIILSAVILVIVIFFGKFSTKMSRESLLVDQLEHCFWYENQGAAATPDIAWMRAIQTSDAVTGEFHYYPAEKDSKTGPFSGTMIPGNNIADVLWTTSGEGMTAVESLRISFGTDAAAPAFGEMKLDKKTGNYVYKNIGKILYQPLLPEVSCAELENNIAAFKNPTPAAPDQVVSEPAPVPPVAAGFAPTDLSNSKWTLAGITGPDTVAIALKTPAKFTLAFSENKLAIGTDCNSAGSDYTTQNNSLTLGPIAMTLMYCDGSDESTYIQILERVQNYSLSAHELTLFTAQGYTLRYTKAK